jgi:hypothetical protein
MKEQIFLADTLAKRCLRVIIRDVLRGAKCKTTFAAPGNPGGQKGCLLVGTGDFIMDRFLCKNCVRVGCDVSFGGRCGGCCFGCIARFAKWVSYFVGSLAVVALGLTGAGVLLLVVFVRGLPWSLVGGGGVASFLNSLRREALVGLA